MNKVILIGNICKDIEIRYTTSGTAVIQNSLAVRNDFKNANGDYESEFVNIVVWKQTAEFLNKYASKGSKIAIDGRLTTRSYDKQDGTKGYITEVVAEKVELLDSKKTNTEPKTTNEKKEVNKLPYEPFKQFGEANGTGITENDLPF